MKKSLCDLLNEDIDQEMELESLEMEFEGMESENTSTDISHVENTELKSKGDNHGC